MHLQIVQNIHECELNLIVIGYTVGIIIKITFVFFSVEFDNFLICIYI